MYTVFNGFHGKHQAIDKPEKWSKLMYKLHDPEHFLTFLYVLLAGVPGESCSGCKLWLRAWLMGSDSSLLPLGMGG